MTRAISGTLAAILMVAGVARADFAINFNNQSDAGLSRVNPLAAVGQAGAFNFPDLGGGNFGYNFTQTGIPSGNAAGPARMASVLTAAPPADSGIAVDVVAWDNTIGQAFGLLSRVTNIGLGTTNGYAFVYQTPIAVGQTNGLISLARITNEATTGIGTSAALTLQAGHSYRFFLGTTGSSLIGSVADLTAPGTALGAVTATDATYATGTVGLIGAGFPPSGTASSVNVTFDNFNGPSAAVPEPSTLALLGLGAAIGLVFRHRLARAGSRSLR